MKNAFYQSGRMFLKTVFAVVNNHVSVLESPFGDSRLANLQGGCILVSNHISHFDPPTISMVCRREVDWMAMDDLFVKQWVARGLTSLGAFPVKRWKPDRHALRIALERLAMGRLVGVFPEGGLRVRSKSILYGAPMAGGAALLSVLSGAPLLPCVILGTDRLYNYKCWSPFHRLGIWMAFGDLIYPTAGATRDEQRMSCEQSLAEVFPELLAKMVERFDLTEDDLPHPSQERRGIVVERIEGHLGDESTMPKKKDRKLHLGKKELNGGSQILRPEDGKQNPGSRSGLSS